MGQAFAVAVAAVLLLAGAGDDGLPAPLSGHAGDAVRGRAIVADRQVGLCVLCHRGPFPEVVFQGDIGPDLAGVGARLSTAQIRLRVADARRVNPASVMPSYFSTEGLRRVAEPFRGKTILTAEQIEDVVAYLTTLKDAR